MSVCVCCCVVWGGGGRVCVDCWLVWSDEMTTRALKNKMCLGDSERRGGHVGEGDGAVRPLLLVLERQKHRRRKCDGYRARRRPTSLHAGQQTTQHGAQKRDMERSALRHSIQPPRYFQATSWGNPLSAAPNFSLLALSALTALRAPLCKRRQKGHHAPGVARNALANHG